MSSFNYKAILLDPDYDPIILEYKINQNDIKLKKSNLSPEDHKNLFFELLFKEINEKDKAKVLKKVQRIYTESVARDATK